MSYWMITAIGLTTNVYLGAIDHDVKWQDSALLLSFFPLTYSGPIVTHENTADSLLTGHRASYKDLTFGLQRIAWGCFKKLVISARLALIVDPVYGSFESYGSFMLMIAIFAFMLQLYTDFSGSMDIVLGVSEIFGINIPENFNTPFFSRSVSEFWRRWHITLGAWLKEFILYPVLRSGVFRNYKKICRRSLGRKWGEKISTYTALLISWFVIGYWHGGGLNYIFGVGIWFWMVIVSSEIISPVLIPLTERIGINRECFSYRLFQHVRTFILVAAGNSFFRADDFRSGVKLWGHMLTFVPGVNGWKNLEIQSADAVIIILGLAVHLIVSIVQDRCGSVRAKVAEQNIVFRWTIYLLLVFGVIILGRYGEADVTQFIYQGF